MFGIEEIMGVTIVVICGYRPINVCGCVWVLVLGVCCEAPYVRFVQSEQSGYE